MISSFCWMTTFMSFTLFFSFPSISTSFYTCSSVSFFSVTTFMRIYDSALKRRMVVVGQLSARLSTWRRSHMYLSLSWLSWIRLKESIECSLGLSALEESLCSAVSAHLPTPSASPWVPGANWDCLTCSFSSPRSPSLCVSTSSSCERVNRNNKFDTFVRYVEIFDLLVELLHFIGVLSSGRKIWVSPSAAGQLLTVCWTVLRSTSPTMHRSSWWESLSYLAVI